MKLAQVSEFIVGFTELLITFQQGPSHLALDLGASRQNSQTSLSPIHHAVTIADGVIGAITQATKIRYQIDVQQGVILVLVLDEFCLGAYFEISSHTLSGCARARNFSDCQNRRRNNLPSSEQ